MVLELTPEEKRGLKLGILGGIAVAIIGGYLLKRGEEYFIKRAKEIARELRGDYTKKANK